MRCLNNTLRGVMVLMALLMINGCNDSSGEDGESKTSPNSTGSKNEDGSTSSPNDNNSNADEADEGDDDDAVDNRSDGMGTGAPMGDVTDGEGGTGDAMPDSVDDNKADVDYDNDDDDEDAEDDEGDDDDGDYDNSARDEESEADGDYDTEDNDDMEEEDTAGDTGAASEDTGQDTGEAMPMDTDTPASDPVDPVDTAIPDTAVPDTDTEALTCDPTAQETYYLSADDSNSMASPVVARWQISTNNLVTADIRTYEFLNYYSFAYAAPEPGTVSVTAEMRADAANEARGYALQIGVRGEDRSNDARRPANLVFSLDTSGSMSGSPLERMKAVCTHVAAHLKDGDVVSIVNWATEQEVILESHPVTGPNDPTLLAAIDGITTGGSTNLYAGLQIAEQMASANAKNGTMSRVILISDGQANTGPTDLNLIAGMSEDSEDEGIYLLGVGVGNGYDDKLMDSATDAGKGAYLFIDTVEEAGVMFGTESRFVANLDIAARAVRVGLTMPVGWYMGEFHGEEYSTVASEVDPQHLAPNDAMIFHQTVAVCGDVPVTGAEEIVVEAEFRDPITREQKTAMTTYTVDQLLANSDMMLKKGTAIVAYAEALKAVQDLMYFSNNYAEIQGILNDALTKVEAARAALADPELEEIANLLTTYRNRFN